MEATEDVLIDNDIVEWWKRRKSEIPAWAQTCKFVFTASAILFFLRETRAFLCMTMFVEPLIYQYIIGLGLGLGLGLEETTEGDYRKSYNNWRRTKTTTGGDS